MDAPWRITKEKVEQALTRIVEVSKPRKVILFGSYVRGMVDRNSDLDILVVTADDIGSPREESVRIRRALRGINMPMDILVVPESTLDAVSDTSGLIYREALQGGRVVYDAAG